MNNKCGDKVSLRLSVMCPVASVLLAGCCVLFPVGRVMAEPADPEMSPFGIGSCHMRSLDHTKWIPQMSSIGLRDLRSFQASWSTVQKGPDTWIWDKVDQQLEYLSSNKVTSGALLLGRGGPWIKQGARRGLPLDMLPEWSLYVSNMVAHTRGRVKYFEVWNEPPNGSGNATPAEYGQLVVATYDAAKSANPDALVGLAAKSAYLYYLDAAIKSGAKGHYDYTRYAIIKCYRRMNG